MEQNSGVGCLLLAERQRKWEIKLHGLLGRHRIMRRFSVKGTARNNLSWVGLILNCVSRVSCHQDRENMAAGIGSVVRVPVSRPFTLHPDTGKREQTELGQDS